MKDINDEVLIGNINIPGTHDSAAINRYIPTPYACQNTTITEQLNAGIRLLDGRVKIKATSCGIELVMCHGNIGNNEYQSFESFLEECIGFIVKHPTEVLIVSLKIDDWNGCQAQKEIVYECFNAMMGAHGDPRLISNMKLKDARGKILMINRIGYNSRTFGPYWGWTTNTDGVTIRPSRNYDVYVQDYYDLGTILSPTETKAKIFLGALKKKTEDNIVLNYASGVHFYLLGVYINSYVINYLGSLDVQDRPKLMGWMLFDYGLRKYSTKDENEDIGVADVIIDSNFGYQKYKTKFSVYHKDL